MKSTRLSTSLAALITVPLVLAGCSTAEPEDDGPVHLTMFYPVAVTGPLTDAVEALVDECSAAQPGLTVDAIYSGGYVDSMTKTLTAARAGEGPDIAVGLQTDIHTYRDQDLIVSFDEIASDLGWSKDRFWDAFMVNSRDAEGTLWSVPFQRSTIVQYYNKDMFAAAGLDPDAAPATWDELVADARAIVDSGAAEVGIEIPSTVSGYWLFQALAIQAGGELFDADSGTETYFDSPQAVKALEFWKKLVDDGLAPQGSTEWGTTPEDFLQGRTAMMWTTTGNLTNVRTNANFSFGVSPLPSGPGGSGSPTGGGNLYIFKDTSPAQRQAALKLAECMTAPEHAAEWSVKTGYVASGPEAWETDAMKDYIAGFPEAAVAKDQLERAIPELTVHENGRIGVLGNDAINSVLTGQSDVETALKNWQAQSMGILKPYAKG